MGCCHSKSNDSPSLPPPARLPNFNVSSSSVRPLEPLKSGAEAREPEEESKLKTNSVQNQDGGGGKAEEESTTSVPKKEIFVIKHRKSHERARSTDPTPDHSIASEEKPDTLDGNAMSDTKAGSVSAVRTSSCTKEEVDAILIQCGRLSRSNSYGVKASPSAKRYSGSKRSFDFDSNDTAQDSRTRTEEEGEGAARPRRDCRRDRSSSSPHERRRRTPSREREESAKQQQRSKSKERSSSTGRRVSRSPGRRSEINNSGSGCNVNPGETRPGKMVSAPATVTSLVMDRSNNGQDATATGVQRISVKRNICEGGPRAAASPRSQSPARANNRSQSPARANNRSQSPARANNGKGCNNYHNTNENHQHSLSRSSSRKAEQSPYRRNPLNEIDQNKIRNKENEGQDAVKHSVNVVVTQKSNAGINNKGVVQTVTSSKPMITNDSAEQQRDIREDSDKSNHLGSDCIKPQGLTRTRSARRSRDLDINVESLPNPTNSYTALLLEDIQNFHQKNTQAPSYLLPACVTKACSIVEAVADLNSSTGPESSDQLQRHEYNLSGTNYFSKTPIEVSRVDAKDDLMEPSFEKYVTVQRGGSLGFQQGDIEEQESSGSNSYAGHWGTPSSREPNSADSTDRWVSTSSSSKSNCIRDRDPSHLRRQNGVFEAGNRNGSSGKKRDLADNQRAGSRVGAGNKGFQAAANSHPVRTIG